MVMEAKRKFISSGQSITEVPHIVNADGHHLFCKYWGPQEPPKLLVCIMHGYGIHCGRHGELADQLNEIGAYVFAHDHIGHGESEGDPWYITDYKVLVRDAIQHVEKVKSSYPNLPIFVYGHSMGGCIAILAAYERPDLFKGVVLSSPSLVVNPKIASPLQQFLLRKLAYFLPRMAAARADLSWLTHDDEEFNKLENDSLRVPHGIYWKTAHSLLTMTDYVRSILQEVKFPLLVQHGEEDMITSIDGSAMVYEQAQSTDKTMHTHPDAYHNLEHEVEDIRMKHSTIVKDWIKDRLD